MNDEITREIVIDALQSVIRDCEKHFKERPRSYLVIISEETQKKVKHALRLFDELDERGPGRYYGLTKK